MLGLFDFLQDFGNHEDRKVDRYHEGDLFVDTCAVSDSTKPFETGIEHPGYNNGNMVIVELYDTKEEAQKGHDKWLDLMLNNPPTVLHNVSTCASASMLREIGKLPPCEKKMS